MTDIQRQKAINKASSIIFSIVRFIIIFGLAFIILKPIISKVFMSFMSPSDMLDNTVNMVPKNPSLYYWKAAIKGLNLAQTVPNTFVLSVGVALIQIISCTLVGYGLARFKFKLNSFFFFCVILLMLVPVQTISTAQFLNFAFFNLGFTTVNITNTFWPIYLMAIGCIGIKNGLYVYLMKAQFESIPFELDEAACIDGAGVWQTFWRVMLPNAKTTIITVFLFSFSWQWTDELYANLYYPNTVIFANYLERVSVAFQNMGDSVGTLIARSAATLIILLPVLILFAFCQKFLVQSISRAGLANG